MARGQAQHIEWACPHVAQPVQERSMLESTTAEALVRELDILIRARYPLIQVTTHEEGRLRRLRRVR